jgi:hypothetical protein
MRSRPNLSALARPKLRVDSAWLTPRDSELTANRQPLLTKSDGYCSDVVLAVQHRKKMPVDLSARDW